MFWQGIYRLHSNNLLYVKLLKYSVKNGKEVAKMTDKKEKRLALGKRNDVTDHSIEAYTTCSCECMCAAACTTPQVDITHAMASGVHTSNQSNRLFI